MFQLRKADERGLGDHGWLKSRHTFSFADYHDPKFMGFRSLRVINEDRIQGGTGFGSHGHRDMEIISYVMSGALEHEDSMGTKATIHPGEVQRMSAGSGVVHSEKNGSPEQEAHFFQIWIQPDQRGIAPGYGQKSFAKKLESHKLVLVVSKDGREGSIPLHQDADIYIARLLKGTETEFRLRAGRGAWTQTLKGEVTVSGQNLKTGDALAADSEPVLKIKAELDSEIMVFDLA